MPRRNPETKKFVVSFRVDRDSKEALELLVEESGLSISNLIRERLNLGGGSQRRMPHMRP